jgi:hypothetical protein
MNLEKLTKPKLVALVQRHQQVFQEVKPKIERIREIIGVKPWEDTIRVLENLQQELTGTYWEPLVDVLADGCAKCDARYSEGYDEGLEEGASDMVHQDELHDAQADIEELQRNLAEKRDEISDLEEHNHTIGGELEDLQEEFKKLKRNHERLKARRKKGA